MDGTLLPLIFLFLEHVIVNFGRGSEGVPRDVKVFQGMFYEEVDEKAVDVNVEDDKEETVKEDVIVNEDKGA